MNANRTTVRLPDTCLAPGAVGRITIRLAADPDTVFAPTAFDHQLGHAIAVTTTIPGVEGKLVAAKVIEDGTAAELTLEVPPMVADAIRAGMVKGIPAQAEERWSFGFTDERPA